MFHFKQRLLSPWNAPAVSSITSSGEWLGRELVGSESRYMEVLVGVGPGCSGQCYAVETPASAAGQGLESGPS